MSEFARSHSRRTVLGAVAAVPALVILPVAASAAPAEPSADAELFDLVAQWRAAERERLRIDGELERAEDERKPVPLPAALHRRHGDAQLFRSPPPGVTSETFDREWIEAIAPCADRARTFAHAHSQAYAARFDEIRRAFGEWSAAEDASRAAAGLLKMRAAGDRAWKMALDLRRRVATTPARTLAGMLAKLGALTAVQGVEVIDDELDLAMAQPELEIDALFFSVARDCAHLAER